MHMQNIICKVEYISCLSIFLLISFLYILLQAVCTPRLILFFFTNLFFLIFLRNYYEQVCRCKSDLYTEHCKFEFMALLITHSIDVQSLPVGEIPQFWFQMKKETIAIMRYIHWIFIRDIVSSIVPCKWRWSIFLILCGVFLDFTQKQFEGKKRLQSDVYFNDVIFVTRFGYS